MSDLAKSGGDTSVAYSQSGLFKQKDGLICDQFVKKLCVLGDYILYAKNSNVFIIFYMIKL